VFLFLPSANWVLHQVERWIGHRVRGSGCKSPPVADFPLLCVDHDTLFDLPLIFSPGFVVPLFGFVGLFRV
jgi:hypothetical protein